MSSTDQKVRLEQVGYVLWFFVNLIGLPVFLYYGYRKRDEFVIRRYPLVTLGQIGFLNLWLQPLVLRNNDASSVLRTLPMFLEVTTAVPMYLTLTCLKVKQLLADHFVSKQLYHEVSKRTKFDPAENLSRLERVFYWMHTKANPEAQTEKNQASVMSRRFISPQNVLCIGLTLLGSAFGILLGLWHAGCFNESKGFDLCSLSPNSSKLYIPLFFISLFYIVIMIALLYVLKDVRDIFQIRNETYFTAGLLLVAFVAQVIVDIAKFDVQSPLGGFFFYICVLPVNSVFMLYFPICCSIRNQRFLQRNQKSMQNSREMFERVLNDKIMMDEFKKVLAESYCLENGLFWTDYQALLKLNSSRASETELTNGLRKLFKKYIMPGAACELNLKGTTSQNLNKSFEAGRLTLDSLKGAAEEVFIMMYMNSFPKLVEKVKKDAESHLFSILSEMKISTAKG